MILWSSQKLRGDSDWTGSHRCCDNWDRRPHDWSLRWCWSLLIWWEEGYLDGCPWIDEYFCIIVLIMNWREECCWWGLFFQAEIFFPWGKHEIYDPNGWQCSTRLKITKLLRLSLRKVLSFWKKLMNFIHHIYYPLFEWLLWLICQMFICGFSVAKWFIWVDLLHLAIISLFRCGAFISDSICLYFIFHIFSREIWCGHLRHSIFTLYLNLWVRISSQTYLLLPSHLLILYLIFHYLSMACLYFPIWNFYLVLSGPHKNVHSSLSPNWK